MDGIKRSITFEPVVKQFGSKSCWVGEFSFWSESVTSGSVLNRFDSGSVYSGSVTSQSVLNR